MILSPGRQPEQVPASESDVSEIITLPAIPHGEGLNPYEFLKFLEANCTPEMLVADRPTQARLRRIMTKNLYHGPRMQSVSMFSPGYPSKVDMEADEGLYPNPAPVIALEHSNGMDGKIEYDSFLLAEPSDDKHRYYFPEWMFPGPPLPSYLRAEDVVLSGFTELRLTQEAVDRICKNFNVSLEEVQNLKSESDPVLDPYKTPVEFEYRGTLYRVPKYGGAEELFNYRTNRWEPTGYIYNAGLRKKVTGQLRKILRPTPRPLKSAGHRMIES